MCIAGGKKILCGIRNAFDAGDERIYGCMETNASALETNTPYSRDELVENVRLLYLAFDWYLYTARTKRYSSTPGKYG